MEIAELCSANSPRPCAFQRIYFSRANDADIHRERKALGAALLPQILKAADAPLEDIFFSYIPNSARIAFHGLLLGGILVGHEVARALDRKCIFAEKQDGRLVMRRFAIEPGEPCIVAEDVVTRGGRVQETIDIVQGLGGRVLAAVTLVDRSGGKASFGAIPHFSLLRMEPETWEPAACPLCAAGGKAVHPGS